MAGIVSVDLGTLASGAGDLAIKLRQAITGDIAPDKKAEIEAKILEFETLARNAQAEINKFEAQHTSIFVSGWRPFIGWICGMALSYVVVNPFITWICIIKHWQIPPQIDWAILSQVMFGMLGIAGMRTYEKKTGVARSK